MSDRFEFSYQHDLDNVIDTSDAVLAIGTEKVDTTTLKDRALSNDATIHGAMPSNEYFLGRRFHDGNNYLDCGNDSSLDITDEITIAVLLKTDKTGRLDIINKGYPADYSYLFYIDGSTKLYFIVRTGATNKQASYPTILEANTWYLVIGTYNATSGSNNINIYVNSVLGTPGTQTGLPNNTDNLYIGYESTGNYNFSGIIPFNCIYNYEYSDAEIKQSFNSIARLPLYSHNFERYPNSDTSLTSVFPYTSGIITSGSFNKTDGLKCTSAGQIVFSNSFEFDGSEYIILIINGVEYSGTTTVTQGTITATIAQGSNDITIDMGTNDVLEDIRVQFREEV